MRGIDRNSDDKSPKNLTKKLKRSAKPATSGKAAKAEAGKGEEKAEGKGKKA
jgi:hypothetical protein